LEALEVRWVGNSTVVRSLTLIRLTNSNSKAITNPRLSRVIALHHRPRPITKAKLLFSGGRHEDARLAEHNHGAGGA